MEWRAGGDEGAGRARLSAQVDLLVGRISRWTAGSWSVLVGTESRADVVFGLIQELADIAADAEHLPRRSVPRLDDGILADQLIVMVHDVLATGSGGATRAALAAVDRAHARLFG